MFRDIFTNRLFIGALVFFVLCVAGSLLYMHHENQKGAEYEAETAEIVRQWNEKQPVEATGHGEGTPGQAVPQAPRTPETPPASEGSVDDAKIFRGTLTFKEYEKKAMRWLYPPAFDALGFAIDENGKRIRYPGFDYSAFRNEYRSREDYEKTHALHRIIMAEGNRRRKEIDARINAAFFRDGGAK